MLQSIQGNFTMSWMVKYCGLEAHQKVKPPTLRPRTNIMQAVTYYTTSVSYTTWHLELTVQTETGHGGEVRLINESSGVGWHAIIRKINWII